jgi:hypothetical protein
MNRLVLRTWNKLRKTGLSVGSYILYIHGAIALSITHDSNRIIRPVRVFTILSFAPVLSPSLIPAIE